MHKLTRVDWARLGRVFSFSLVIFGIILSPGFEHWRVRAWKFRDEVIVENSMDAFETDCIGQSLRLDWCRLGRDIVVDCSPFDTQNYTIKDN